MIKNWLLAARPKTLTAALVPIVVATAAVFALGYKVHWWISVFALMASLFIQVATNLVNDAVDFKKGADDENRLGPQRVTQSGVFSYQKVIVASAVCFLLALSFGIPLVIIGGWPIVIIGLASIFFGAIYTAGPFPLAYLGLGDFFVVLFFGLVAVCGLGFLHTGQWLEEFFVLGLQVGLHCAILIAINNLRDVENDRKANKKTLPVRFGKTFARIEIALLSLVPFLLLFYWFVKGKYTVVLLPFLTLPLAFQIVFLVYKTEPSAVYNKYLAKSAGLHLLFGLLVALGLVI